MRKSKMYIAALLAAFMTAAPLSTMPAAAAYDDDVEAYSADTDEIGMHYTLSTDGYRTCFYTSRAWEPDGSYFLAVTTAEGLPEELLAEQESPIRSVLEWKDYKFYDYTVALDTSEIVKRYGADARIYRVYYNISREELSIAAREFAVEHESVLQTMLLEHKYSGTCIWDGTIQVGLSREDSILLDKGELPGYTAILPELQASYVEWRDKYKDWRTKYDGWCALIETQEMTPQERLASLNEWGITDPYTMTMSAVEQARTLYTAHSDVLKSVTPGLGTFENTIITYQTRSAWDGVGDVDGDGTVTAADATEMLITASYRGAGLNYALSSAARTNADVNMDGSINAEDAAYTLQYAASQGAGTDTGDIGEYVMGSLRQQ